MQRGLSLVEIVVASVVLAVMAAPLISMMFSSKVNENRSSVRLQALLLAQGYLEEAIHNCQKFNTTMPRRIPVVPDRFVLTPYQNRIDDQLFEIRYRMEFEDAGRRAQVEVSSVCSLLPQNFEYKKRAN